MLSDMAARELGARDRADCGLRSICICCRDWIAAGKLVELTLASGSEAEDMNGRRSAEPSIGCDASRLGFPFTGRASPKRATQHAFRTSSE